MLHPCNRFVKRRNLLIQKKVPQYIGTAAVRQNVDLIFAEHLGKRIRTVPLCHKPGLSEFLDLAGLNRKASIFLDVLQNMIFFNYCLPCIVGRKIFLVLGHNRSTPHRIIFICFVLLLFL